MADLEDIIMRCVQRFMTGRYSERHGLVTSYDPMNYLAKVTFMPEGQESGWLPIETGHIGNGYGIAVGLETGDGKSTGDQVVVRFQEGDFESGKIVQRVHSDADKPPPVQSGEMVMWTKWGQKISFSKDGTLTFQTGQMTGQDPGDNSAQSEQSSAKQVTVMLDASGNISTTAANNITHTAAATIAASAANISETASQDITETASQNINQTASKNITSMATLEITQTAKKDFNINGDSVVVNGGGASQPPVTIS